MTRTQLYDRITQCVPAGYRYEIGQAVEEIWGQPFDGETEKINTAKSASSTSPAAEQSSATLSESFPDGTTYTRSYQVFLPNPTPTQPQ
jgi:hypothetical protein